MWSARKGEIRANIAHPERAGIDRNLERGLITPIHGLDYPLILAEIGAIDRNTPLLRTSRGEKGTQPCQEVKESTNIIYGGVNAWQSFFRHPLAGDHSNTRDDLFASLKFFFGDFFCPHLSKGVLRGVFRGDRPAILLLMRPKARNLRLFRFPIETQGPCCFFVAVDGARMNSSMDFERGMAPFEMETGQ